MGKGIDALTVVIKTDNLGQIIKVYSDLPLTVVKIDNDDKGGTVDVVEPLSSMTDSRRSAVRGILDPYIHLDPVQLDRIDQVAVDTLTSEGTDAGFRRGVMSAYVEKMTVGEKLACISGEDECLKQELGFDPATGKDVEEEDDDWEPKSVWVQRLADKSWHWLKKPADDPVNPKDNTRTATCGCGKNVCFDPAVYQSVACGQPPKAEGDASTCLDCLYKNQIEAEVKKPCCLNWGRTRIKKTWHVVTTEPKKVYPDSDDKTKKMLYEVDTVCGLKQAIVFGLPTPMECTEQPAPSSDSYVCPECAKYRMKKEEEDK